MNNFKIITTASSIMVVGLSLSGCELLAHKQAPLLPLPPVAKELPSDKKEVVYSELENKSPSDQESQLKSELYPGTNRFIPSTKTEHRRTGTTGAGSYKLNFDEADLGEVAKVVLGDILGQNYVLSPKVAGKVTLQTTEPLTKEELLPTLEMVLRMNNAALVKDGNIYHIEPVADALYSSDISSGGRSGFQTRVIPVKNVAVEDIMEVIKPLVQEKTILKVDGTRNVLVASGTPDEMARVLDMVSTFDIDVLRGRSFGLFPLAHAEPDSVIEELEAVFNKSGKADDNEFFKFIAIERLNAIMAITHQARYLNDIESWVHRLDKANTASGGGVNVYRAQHADAEELAGTLNEIFTGAQKQEKSAKVAAGQKSAEISNKQAPDKAVSKKGSVSVSSKQTQTGDAKVADVENVRIIADKANNSIVIVATPREYGKILPVIKQLDVMPLQVLIDATIVSVKLTDKLEYGISWYLSNNNDSLGGNKAGATALGTAAAAAAAASTGGLSAVYSSGTVKALLSAQSDLGNVNVISSPSLMVLNNQQAKINVGDQVPIQTSTLTNAVSSTDQNNGLAQSSQIEYKDTGVTLDVTPRVNANGMVIMEIKQEVSTAVETTTGVDTSPTIQKKEIESYVAVHDGETIVLGGLIDQTNTVNKNGIPFLHELPWIGSLFGKKSDDTQKNELVVLITPRVVKSKQDSREISDEFKRKLTGIYDVGSVEKPRNLY